MCKVLNTTCKFVIHPGMLSKSKGQILHIAATLHVLFNWEHPKDVPKENSVDALKAAINFVDMCIQHSAFLAGRGDIDEAISKLQKIKMYALLYGNGWTL